MIRFYKPFNKKIRMQIPSLSIGVECTVGTNYKQLLDEVFVICGIIKVSVRVISLSRNNQGRGKCFRCFPELTVGFYPMRRQMLTTMCNNANWWVMPRIVIDSVICGWYRKFDWWKPKRSLAVVAWRWIPQNYENRSDPFASIHGLISYKRRSTQRKIWDFNQTEDDGFGNDIATKLEVIG